MDRKRDQYKSGAVRDSRAGKGRFDLIDPFFEQAMANLMEYGAEHYTDHNWRQGFPFSRVIDSMKRHINRFQAGQPDKDHDDNMAAVAFGAMCIAGYQELIERGLLPAELNDLPSFNVAKPEHLGLSVGRAARMDQAMVRDVILGAPFARRIYVAGPFTAESASARFWNWFIAVYVGLVLTRMGHLVHVPHAATGMWNGWVHYERFMELDITLLRYWATDLFYLGESPGADREKTEAKGMKLPIHTDVRKLPVRFQDAKLLKEFKDVTPDNFLASLPYANPRPAHSGGVPDWVRARLAAVGVLDPADVKTSGRPGDETGGPATCHRCKVRRPVWSYGCPDCYLYRYPHKDQ